MLQLSKRANATQHGRKFPLSLSQSMPIPVSLSDNNVGCCPDERECKLLHTNKIQLLVGLLLGLLKKCATLFLLVVAESTDADVAANCVVTPSTYCNPENITKPVCICCHWKKWERNKEHLLLGYIYIYAFKCTCSDCPQDALHIAHETVQLLLPYRLHCARLQAHHENTSILQLVCMAANEIAAGVFMRELRSHVFTFHLALSKSGVSRLLHSNMQCNQNQ